MFDDDLGIIIFEPEDFVVDVIPDILDLSYLGSRNYQEFEAEAIRLTNQIRVERGLHALTENKNLSQSSLAHALDMAENRFINHTGSDGSKVSQRVTRANYNNWVAVGENLAMGHRTPEDVIQGWMNSPGHRENLLNAKFYEIGVAYIEGDIVSPDGMLWRGGYWVQNFGARLSHIGAMAGRAWQSVTASTARPEEETFEILILNKHAQDTKSHN